MLKIKSANYECEQRTNNARTAYEQRANRVRTTRELRVTVTNNARTTPGNSDTKNSPPLHARTSPPTRNKTLMRKCHQKLNAKAPQGCSKHGGQKEEAHRLLPYGHLGALRLSLQLPNAECGCLHKPTSAGFSSALATVAICVYAVRCSFS